jgi:hypothetical protein
MSGMRLRGASGRQLTPFLQPALMPAHEFGGTSIHGGRCIKAADTGITAPIVMKWLLGFRRVGGCVSGSL